ncbi:T-box transcription factor TBX15 [Varanus komodoensis]|nr:T-box transcription factor TBX15 [Varanus komodoensis]
MMKPEAALRADGGSSLCWQPWMPSEFEDGLDGNEQPQIKSRKDRAPETQSLIWHSLLLLDSEQSTGSDTEVLAERTSCSFGSHTDLTSGGSVSQPPPTSSMEEIQVELQCADLWKRFHDIGTEMIITKAGR